MPFELLTLLGGVITGGGLKIGHMIIQGMLENHKIAIAKGEQYEKSLESARRFMHDGGKWTRSLIVMACLMVVILFRIIASLFIKDLPINYLYSEATGFFFSYDKVKTLTTTGVTILPVHTHSLLAIVGFYFGSRIGK